MSSEARTGRFNVLVVHHDAVVLEDLCDIVTTCADAAKVVRATSVSDAPFGCHGYDAALIEVSRNKGDANRVLGPASGAIGRIIWITDDLHPEPDLSAGGIRLHQPFRTEDVAAALRASGLIGPDDLQ